MRHKVAVLAVAAVSVAALEAGIDSGWSVYGGEGNRHYSKLNQITPENVAKLAVAWKYESGDEFPGSEIECNPIVVDGTLYATTPTLRAFALDAATGKLKWSFDPNEGRPVKSKARNRGVSFWRGEPGSTPRIFYTARQYLFALDASTGKPMEDFGDGGKVDLRENLGRDPAALSVSATTPPTIYKDLVITGSIVSESLPSAPGDIRAYDAETGRLRWAFHTIPHPGEPGYETWPKDAWTYSGGANNWNGMALDPETGVLFVPTGSAAFDFYGADRLGTNLYADCLLALDAGTGKRIWHFQEVHHDIWDRDLPAPPALVTVTRNGKPVKALAQITKSGLVYLLRRENGKPLFPVREEKFPASEAEGEKTSKTQPMPLLPEAFARQRLTEDLLSDRTPEIHEELADRFKKLKSNGQFEPPSLAGTIIFPGFDGGGEWGGPAYDSKTGLLYVNANEMAWVLRLVPKQSSQKAQDAGALYQAECAGCHRKDRAGSPPEFPSLRGIGQRLTIDEVTRTIRAGSGRMPAFSRLGNPNIQSLAHFLMTGESKSLSGEVAKTAGPELKYGIDGYNKFLDRDGYPAVKPPWGTMNAIDLNSGKIAWKVPLGEYPELAEKGLGNTGSENYGGPVVTENGLLFVAATSYDRKIRAFDKANGKLLWEAQLPFAGNATPALYQVDGREFLVVACGGGKSKAPTGSVYLAFALPQSK